MQFQSRREFGKLCTAAVVAMAGSSLFGCSDSSTSSDSTTDTSASEEAQTATLFLFDTTINLKAYCSQELMNSAAERCNYFEQHFSRTIEGSDIWNINNAKGAPTEVAEETADIITKALTYCKKSDGLFDITIGAVSSLWDFVEGVKPADEDVREAIKHIDYRGVHVDGTTVTLDDPSAMIDLGGVAKGYIADDLKTLFEDGGCTSGYINLGGNVFVIGKKPTGEKWKVGVQDPNETKGYTIAKIECSEKSVVTSGLYERQFTAEDGKTYYHILDPKTGYPVKSDLASSSVLSDSSLDGDAYATWMFLLGHDKALELLNSTDGLEGLVVNKNDVVTQSKGNVFEVNGASS